MSRRRKYRRILVGTLVVNLFAIAAVYLWTIDSRIPNYLMLPVGREEILDFNVPVNGQVGKDNISVFSGDNPLTRDTIHFDFNNPVSMQVSETGSYEIDVSLFGLIHLKNITVDAVEPVSVVPGGENIGIYVETKGVMVLGTGSVTGLDGMKYEPAQNIIKTGDYIIAINGQEISTIGDMTELVDSNGKEELVLTVIRNGENQKLRINPVQTGAQDYQLGIWVRDDTQGVGTLTYRTFDGEFGALGHGITDSDTGLLIEINQGKIYDTEIVDIVKGQQGEPGEMVGIIRSSEAMRLGSVEKNTDCGIFGTIKGESTLWSEKDPLSIGFKQEIKKGKASILCELGEGIEEYEIEIEKIRWNSESESKGMVIKITDERLLKKTNGIVQGMSGSPIIQGGKLVGAVTHVFIQDSSRGYGIFIENMLKK